MKFKKRYIVYTLALAYLLFAHSCMTMRTSPKKTKAFFDAQKVAYADASVMVRDQNIHYIETGDATAHNLVFVHGSPGSWDAWKNYLIDSTLRKSYRIIAVDRPGFGYSDFRKSQDITTQAQVLNEFLTLKTNGKPITLIGHSYGGPLIVKMALENPELHQNLLILAGALDPNAEKPEKWRKPLRWFPLKYLVPGSLRPSNDELWWLKQELWDMQPELKYLTQNVQIIHGKLDKLVPYSNVGYMQESFVNVESLTTVTLDEENHFIVWTREDLIKEVILSLAK